MPPLNYSAAELASLAPEERAALEAADGTDADVLTEIAGAEETSAAAAPAADAGTTAAAAPAQGDAAAAAGAAPAQAPAAAPAASAEQTPAAPSAAPTPNTVVYRAQVGDLTKEVGIQKASITAARTEKRQALMKLNDGEIDADEYARIEDAADAKIDAANDRIMEINRAATRAEVSEELTAQQQQNAWKTMLTGFVKDAKTAGLDLSGDEKLRTEFNALLKGFATEAEARGMSDDDGMSASAYALEQAKIMLGLRHGKSFGAQPAATPAAPAAAGGTPAAPAGAPAAAAPAQRPVIPPTLGQMPAAAASPVGDDIMAKVATLEGDELELYIASLPKEQAQRLMAGAQ